MKYLLPLLLIALLFTSGCKKETVAKTYRVSYSIGCTDCEVIYVKDTEGTQQTEYHQNSNWTYSFMAKQGQEVLLLAYNTAGAPQGVTATIRLNDSILTTQTTYCPVSGVSFVVDTIR